MANLNFYSHGKLLITGEYLVLFGASALALPVKYGQSLQVTKLSPPNVVRWIANEMGKEWFSAEFKLNDLSIQFASDEGVAQRLQKILLAALRLSPGFMTEAILVETNTDFPRIWGLGTSSTLIANIAHWAGIDPLRLHWEVSSGSGYDIVCASSSKPLVYKLDGKNPLVNEVVFHPSFSDHIFFVHLGNKQDSAKSVESFLKSNRPVDVPIQQISEITERLLTSKSLEGFIDLLCQHEVIMSGTIGLPTVQQLYFQEFPGVVKSLGAWGGDFVMAVSPSSPAEIVNYFADRGYSTVLGFKEVLIRNMN